MSIRTLALAAALTIAADARAQSPISVGLAAGANFPSGDLSRGTNTGYNIQGSIAANIPAAPIGFRADVLYSQLGIKAPGTGNFNILGVNGNATVGIPIDIGFSPYLIGGVGYYRVSPDNVASENKVGLNGGIGTRFGLAGFSTFAEVRYHNIFTSGSSTQFVPLTFGIMF
ncbi:MAG: hypothetical protein NVS1B4_01720 [Gemmatimonadaceae bacterium]